MTGQCECNYGFRGTSCMSECPGGASNPCSGHGRCNDQSFCECSESWAGEKCDDLCPGGLTNPCSGHGKCVTNQLNKSNATCVCEKKCVTNQSNKSNAICEGDGTIILLYWTGWDCRF